MVKMVSVYLLYSEIKEYLKQLSLERNLFTAQMLCILLPLLNSLVNKLSYNFYGLPFMREK